MTRITKLLRYLLRAERPQGNVDAAAGNRFSGWAFAAQGDVRIEARIGQTLVAATEPSIDRRDVALAYPEIRGAKRSGFLLTLPDEVIAADRIVDVRIEARPVSGFAPSRTIGCFAMAGPALIEALSSAPSSGIVGPFPRTVTDAVAALWPEDCRDLGTVAGQRVFARRLATLFSTPSLRSLPAIAEYARYLQATWAHFNFVEKYFPAQNTTVQSDSADFHCKPNSIFEIFSIAHQLYVLKSFGVTGDFAEFGCFKGFSSAMLSFACQQLGLKMHIFDSFEGLPPAEGSGYSAGEYAGSLEEVSENVTRFGAVSVVEFHKGFFGDTLRSYRPPPLICLWMDVDLEVSARDMIVVADLLDPRSALFSHECTADIFCDGTIETIAGPDNPIPPVLARFDALGRPLTGRFIRGNTGAFWPRERGIPVVDHDVLSEIVQAAL